MTFSFWPLTPPGAPHAAPSAPRRSAQERTPPLRITSPPFASTVTWLASISALRRDASSILRLISLAAIYGFSWIRDALDPAEAAHGVFRPFTLVIPLDLPFKCHPG